MKVYISGKITGTNDYMERFERAEILLTDLGYEAVNPAKENAKLPNNTTWEVYMKNAIKLLCDCDKIHLLPGWERSKGAVMEEYIARCLGIERV